MSKINKVAVLGSGTMGSGIAAQVANAGVPVLLLDMTREIAAAAKDSLYSRKPAPLMSPAAGDLLMTGSFDDDLQQLADCDWIVEVIVERLEPKQQLFQRVQAVRKPGSVVTSNTSGLLISEIIGALPTEFAEDFLITHFFNPPRYMPLVELVAGENTQAGAYERIKEFCTVALGKVVVDAKDTPCFIGNRVGVYTLIAGLRTAVDLGITVEEADAAAGRPMGWPGTGLFGLLDLVGFDVVGDICENMKGQLTDNDAARPFLDLPAVAQWMLAEGMVGRKAGKGFYRQSGSGPDRVRESLDLATREYRPWQGSEHGSARCRSVAELVECEDIGGRFAWELLANSLGYAATVAAEIADDVMAIDSAMREGFSWKFGPFELLDQIGVANLVERFEREGRVVPELLRQVLTQGDGRFYRDGVQSAEYFGLDGQYHVVEEVAEAWQVATLSRRSQPLFENASASIWDAGEGIALLDLHSKMNAVDDQTIVAMIEARSLIENDFRGLVIGTDGPNISVGANLQTMLDAAVRKDWDFLSQFIGGFQQALLALKLAPVPVVVAARGLALGGGCELVLHGNAVQAHAELAAGLVELKVGLIPAGGGTKEMVLRHTAGKQGDEIEVGVREAFELIASARVSASAAQARQMGILSSTDGVTMNRMRLLADARARAVAMSDNYQQLQAATRNLPGRALLGQLEDEIGERLGAEKISPHDAVVARQLAWIVTGGDVAPGPVTEQQLFDMELEVFLRLLGEPASLARMEHMLKTGKPLRN
ncbi:MAG: 3-hydroxyacyl-CoA dehydrogenase [Gammaproteobacteria bacterium]|nr:MAG: 3-hydroxyacyl-CoA dehydrogenase [Gammaproteobacteria bacterium]